MTPDPPIASLRNLGPKSSARLQEVGIARVSDLKRVGAVVAYRAVKQSFPGTTLNLLWALAAGLRGADWRCLEDAEKQSLLRDLNAK